MKRFDLCVSQISESSCGKWVAYEDHLADKLADRKRRERVLRARLLRGIAYTENTTNDKGYAVALQDVLNWLDAGGLDKCPNDTNGDGDCGKPACPVCGLEEK